MMTLQYKKIADGLAKAEPEYKPFFWEDSEGRIISRDWAQGFHAGMELREKAWAPLMDGEEHTLSVMLKVLLQPEEICAKAIEVGLDAEEMFAKAQKDTANLVHFIRNYWWERGLPQRLAALHTAQKVGRNDPCPCGSGKKYKKCCLN